jgi:hypothetical protein
MCRTDRRGSGGIDGALSEAIDGARQFAGSLDRTWILIRICQTFLQIIPLGFDRGMLLLERFLTGDIDVTSKLSISVRCVRNASKYTACGAKLNVT